jgi:hypothetical protein
VLKFLVFAASAIPVFIFLKTIFFRRSPTVRAARSAFDRQVGYLATGIVTLALLSVVYFFLSNWLSR